MHYAVVVIGFPKSSDLPEEVLERVLLMQPNEARELAQHFPTIVCEVHTRGTAENIASRLRDAGGLAEVKPVLGPEDTGPSARATLSPAGVAAQRRKASAEARRETLRMNVPQPAGGAERLVEVKRARPPLALIGLVALLAYLSVRIAYASSSAFFSEVEAESAVARSSATPATALGTGRVHGLFMSMPEFMRGPAIDAARWVVPGTHVVRVQWPDAGWADRTHTTCMLVEHYRSQFGGSEATSRLRRLLATGRSVDIPAEVAEQLRVHENEIREHSARFTFTQLCLER